MTNAPIVPEYIYNATVHRWVDGDTVYLNVDLGFRISTVIECRLLGLNTPERGQINYKEATLEANRLAPVGSPVVIETKKDPEKYGRWLTNLYAQDVDVDEALIAAGLGVLYFGGKR